MRKNGFQRFMRMAAALCLAAALTAGLAGCEALGKKFIRHPKGEEKLNEPVLVPQEYPSLFKNSAEAYRQYLFYWKSWQDELLNAIDNHSSNKKKASCIDEGIKNLVFMKNLLRDDKQKGLDGYIRQLLDLKGVIGDGEAIERIKAESIRRNILRDYSLDKVKGSFKDDTGTD